MAKPCALQWYRGSGVATTEFLASPWCLIRDSAFACQFRALRQTPLGLPVVPDVYIIVARGSSGSYWIGLSACDIKESIPSWLISADAPQSAAMRACLYADSSGFTGTATA